MIRTTPLHSAATEYALARGLAGGSAYQLQHSVSMYCCFVGPNATVADLDAGTVNQWLSGLEVTHARRTVLGHRRNLLALWRFAADACGLDEPYRIRRIYVPRPIPQAWSLDEFRRLVTSCASVPHGDYLALLCRIAYQTGLRRGDCLRLTADDVAEDGQVCLVQHKTGHGHVCRMDAATAAELRARGNMLPPCSLRRVYRLLDLARRLAGLKKGALQQIRRTGATAVEQQTPGAAQRYLGHRSPGLAYRYYIDASKITATVQPPPLD